MLHYPQRTLPCWFGGTETMHKLKLPLCMRPQFCCESHCPDNLIAVSILDAGMRTARFLIRPRSSSKSCVCEAAIHTGQCAREGRPPQCACLRPSRRAPAGWSRELGGQEERQEGCCREGSPAGAGPGNPREHISCKPLLAHSPKAAIWSHDASILAALGSATWLTGSLQACASQSARDETARQLASC